MATLEKKSTVFIDFFILCEYYINMIRILNRYDFNYLVIDEENQPVRRFLTYSQAKEFVKLRPEFKITKIQHIDWNNYEEALF